MKVVTSFSPEGYKEYGRKFLQSFLKHWPLDIWVYYEGEKPEETDERIHYVDLLEDKKLRAFLDTASGYEQDWYKKNASKFARKVFALTDPKRISEVDTDWWIWLDADTETFAEIDEAFLKKVCPDGFIGSYLGRKDWHHSECGFVGYNMDQGAASFLEIFRAYYKTGSIFTLKEWHDSFVFDRARSRSPGWWYNISEGVAGMHVWDDCILGTKMRHLKGPLRKKGVVPQDPNYASKKEIATTAQPGKQKLLVKTRNCVPDNRIQANIRYNLTVIDKWIKQCRRSPKNILFCSGGPSLDEQIDAIKKKMADPNNVVVCVKYAHDRLIENGIIPQFCVLLDPRNHVAEVVDNPHKDVIYLVASMCHPTTVDTLIEAGVQVWGYHAHVGAGEQDVIKQLDPKAFMVGGGCSAAMRGMGVLHCLGLRSFELFGYDLCYFDEPDWTAKTKDGENKYLEVEVGGKKFWTDAEKVAQAQDFQKILKEDVELQAYGPGMVPHILKLARKQHPSFEDLFFG